MRSKRLLLSAVLGLALGTTLFTSLISFSMLSVDYDNLHEPKHFHMMGINYLTVEKIEGEIEQQINAAPIAIASTVLGGLSYLYLTLKETKETKEAKTVKKTKK